MSGMSLSVTAQNIAISAATGGLASTPLSGGVTNVAVLGVQLSKAGGGTRTVTGLTFPMTTDPNGKFLNPRLYESADATFSGVLTETLIAGGVTPTLNTTDISFSGGTITNFDGASGADDEYIFLVVDVVSGVTGATAAIVPSLASTGVTTAATVTGGPITGTSYLFVAPVTNIANLSTGLATSPLMAGATGQAVFGFSLTSTGTQTVSVINVQVTSTAVSKWGSYTLITSGDNSFATTGDNSVPIGGLSFDASSGTQIAITGLTESITTSAKNYFLVVTVNSGVTTGTTGLTPSLALANVTAAPGTVTGSAAGTAYTFTAPVLTLANLSAGLAASPLNAGATGQGVFGFSLASTGTQTVSAINVQVTNSAVSKWGSYSLITSGDGDFSTTGDNSGAIGGLSFDASSGTHIAITGLSESITTTKNYFLVVNVNASVNAATAHVHPSLALADVSASPGTVTGSAAGTDYGFAPLLTLATLSTGTAPSPLIAGATGQGVFGFSLASSGTNTINTINVQVTGGSPATKWTTASYSLITSVDASFATTGDNSVPIGGLTFTPSATQIAITGLSQVITAGTNYFLVVNVDPGVTAGTSAIQASLVPANLSFTGGGTVTGSATGTNYSFILATATFTEITAGTAPVISGTLLSAGSNLQVLTGFSATSNGTQQITAINFNYTPAAPTAQFATERLYRSTVAGSVGVEVDNDGSADGNFTGLTETINSTPVYFYLVVDVANSATAATPSVQVAPTQANITVAGNKNALSISRTFTFNTSQTSDITLTAPFTTLIGYRTRQFTSIDNTDISKSVSLATYSLRDGGGSDSDNKGTNLTSLTISLSNSGYVRQIALFDNDTNVEIAGTEQTVTGGSVTFTPSSPISTSDNGVRNLAVRATFQAIVIDNAHIQLQITGATANTSGSGFSPLGGWASTTTNPSHNLIDVVATKLVFDILPSTVSLNTDFTVRVKALDGLNNLDVNQTDQFSLSETGPGNLTSFGGTTLTPFLVAGQFTWTDLRLNLSGSYPFIASDDAYDDDMGGDATGNITINSPASTIGPLTDPVFCYGNASSAKNLGSIVITETDPAGISGSNGSYTFSLALPSGFVFDQSVTTGLSLSGGTDISTPSAYTYPGVNVVQFSFNLTGTSNLNTITIGGLRVHAPHPGTDSPAGTGPLTITRLGGSATIAGVTAGTTLATISATQQNPAVTFTVDELTGNPEVDPSTTTFNVSSAPVKLISSTPAGSTFTGNGVTSNPEYRFNPNSLSSGTYPVTLTQTAGSGCQSYFTQDFEVIISGIVGLNGSYCSNDLPATGLTVNQAYIDQIMQYYLPSTGWTLDKFVYYDHDNATDRWQNISPTNNSFDPKANAYADEFAYWGGEIPIGFSVYNTAAGVNPGDNYVVTYQWVRVNSAPTVSLVIPKVNFCMGDATVDLIGVPANTDDILVDYFRIDGAVDPRLTQVGTSPKVWKFTPGSVGASNPVGSFSLTYSYLDPATSCRGISDPVTIKVNEVVPNITFPNNICAGDPVNITNTSTVRAASTTIVKAGWNFGDFVILPPGAYASTIATGAAERTTGTYQNPSHLYDNNGTFQISATIETSDGCVYQTPSQPVNINALPNANFTWTNACLGSPTSFNATQNLADGQILSWNWNFATQGSLSGTGTATGKNTSFTYAGVGKDTVQLIVITNTLCKDTVYKPVFIVPTYGGITGSTGYSQGFSTSDGWITGGKNSSWQLGIPTGSTIKPVPLGGGNAWDTNPAGQNNPQESSWVMSGCFDFSGSSKPVISFDTWSDNQYGADGAVLQYNITGNIEELVSPSDPEGDWVTVGVVGQGIKWYDDQGILSNPGNQSSTSAGWTGKDGGWKKSTFKLDPLIGQSRVLLRVAFASSLPRGDGFAFDNVFVGERSRIVLLENFTNAEMTPPSGTHNEDNYQNIGTAGELVKIQYHTNFPVLDPVNELNEQMHNARSAFYGITQSPTIRIDGDFKSGDIPVWRDDLYDERVLTPSPIRLSVLATKVGDIVKINTTIENTTSQSISLSGLNMFTTIVQKSVTSTDLLGSSGNSEFVFVAKQMLPSPAGITLSETIPANGTYAAPEVIWQNPVGDAVVVFVQNITGKKDVYQASILNAPALPDIVTGTEDPEYVKGINLYPNPAKHELNIILPASVNKTTPITLTDAFGRVVYQDGFNAGERTKNISTDSFADGIYMLQISAPQGTKVTRKVMVKH